MREASATTPRRRREPIHLRADRPHTDFRQCTYIGDFSRCQCLQPAQPGTDRCALPGHERGAA